MTSFDKIVSRTSSSMRTGVVVPPPAVSPMVVLPSGKRVSLEVMKAELAPHVIVEGVPTIGKIRLPSRPKFACPKPKSSPLAYSDNGVAGSRSSAKPLELELHPSRPYRSRSRASSRGRVDAHGEFSPDEDASRVRARSPSRPVVLQP